MPTITLPKTTGTDFDTPATNEVSLYIDDTTGNLCAKDEAGNAYVLGVFDYPHMVPVGDETTTITTGTAKLTFRIPFACTMVKLPRANLNTVSSSGAPAIDINKNGVSIFTTTLTIDANEKTSITAATSAVLSGGSTTFADDDEVTVDIDAAGTGAKGLKITFYLRPTA